MNHFAPPRFKGILFYGTVMTILTGGGGGFLWLALNERSGANILLDMLLALVLFIPVPFLVYRAYALFHARYILDRNGLCLRWGLRSEDIPLPDIEWIRLATDFAIPLPLPLFHFSGIMRGRLNIQDLGPVEFLASDVRTLLLVATSRQIFVISPANITAFLAAFQDAWEHGSPSPLPSRSTLPVAFMWGIWSDRAARVLLFTASVLAIIFLGWISWVIPSRKIIPLGFDTHGRPYAPAPAEQILLLPALTLFFLALDFLGGAFFYRNPTQRPLAYILWAGSALTSILLMTAAWFLLSRM